MLSDKELLKQFQKHKDIDEYGNASQLDFSRRAHRFNSGDKGIYTADVSDGGEKRIIVFNKVKPYVDAVAGFFRQIRRQPEYSARVQNDEQQESLSEILSGASQYIRENANMDFYESAQDKEMLITGLGAIDTNILYETNPDGEVKAEVIEYDDLGFDPQARAPNLLDARWIRRRKKYSLDEALKRFKGSKADDFEAVTDNPEKKVFNPFDGQYTAIAIDTHSDEDDLVQVHYYQWWELQTYYRANNPLKQEDIDPLLAERMVMLLEIVKENRASVEDEYVKDDLFSFDPTADTLSMSPKIKNDVVEAFAQYGITLETQEYLKKCYYTAILSDTKVFKKFKSPNQEGFTIKVKTGDYDRECGVWYGLVRQLEEPNRYANKALTEILYTIAFNSKGGIMYEKGATDDPQRLEREYASTKAAIRVNDGALSGGQIQPKAQAALPTGFENVYDISNNSMGEVTGINKEFLGSSENKQVSALLEAQRIQQVSAVLANYIDSISLYTIEEARLMLTFIRQLADNRARPIEIKQQDGTRRIEYLRKELLAEEYDIKIGEMLSSPAQQAETGTILLTVAQQVALLGKDIYPVVVDYIPGVKFADRKRLQEILNPEMTPEQMQQQQMMQQITIAGQKAKISKDVADAEYKYASVDREKAETVRTIAEAHQKDMENQLAREIGVDKITVNI